MIVGLAGVVLVLVFSDQQRFLNDTSDDTSTEKMQPVVRDDTIEKSDTSPTSDTPDVPSGTDSKTTPDDNAGAMPARVKEDVSQGAQQQ